MIDFFGNHPLCNLIQNSIDEPARFFRGIFLGDLNGFVDRYLDGNFLIIQKFADGESEDVSVYNGDSLKFPILCDFLDDTIDFL